MDLIVKKTGRPSAAFISKARKHSYRQRLREQQTIPAPPFERTYSHASVSCISLLRGLLEVDPDERMSADRALQHPYFSTVAVEERSAFSPMSLPAVFPLRDFEFEDRDANIEDLREEIFEEVLKYHPGYPTVTPTTNFLSPRAVNEQSPHVGSFTAGKNLSKISKLLKFVIMI